MADVTVPDRPVLAHLANVELMHAGTWSASTGVHTFTADDFAFAVAALDCPAVRRPYLKLGHTDPRFDGEPACGWIDNLHTASEGRALVGDYVGMPGWLGSVDENGYSVLASAYPDRSIEGQWDFRCALGHTHPFVLTGVALLGVTPPAIGTLTSLQDVGALYGVAASSAHGGTPVSIQLKGSAMPNPKPRTVAAGVTTEDVRRAYYDTAGWDVWIEEMHLDPLQLIVIDDSDGSRSRIPITVDPDGDGTDGVTFGQAVPVVVRYEDATTAPAEEDPAVAASANSPIVRYANRAESRPGEPPRASSTPAAASAAGSHLKGGSAVALTLTDEQEISIREALGLAEDADADAIVTAVEDLATAPEGEAEPEATASAATPSSVAAAAARLGLRVVDDEALEARLSRGDAAFERLEREDRERVVDAALANGKITPARRDHWLTLMSADREGTTAILEGLPKELAVPLSEVGHGRDSEVSASTNVRESDVFKNWSI
ncbi:phage protease [Rhodococcus opacus]|uniref:phage protease n=1 Tax=Rhodococcus opacus TaxID=37919 RepID=UPI0006BB50D6|nr:phage protease [Rhodococcus opacus]